MKRRTRAGGTDPTLPAGDTDNHPQRPGDDTASGRHTRSGGRHDDPSVGSLRWTIDGPSPAYISGPPPTTVERDTPLLVLEIGRRITSCGDTAIRVVTGDGRIGWMWSSTSREGRE